MSASDAVDGSSTGIAMCQGEVVNQELRMTDFGTKQTFQPMRVYVRYWG
jgi:hypothetical protein